MRSAIPGVVRNVRVELGARVDEGTPLFEIASPRIGEIQGSLQTARERVRAAEADLARLRELRRGDIASARQVEVAQRELAAARASASAAETALGVAGANDTMPSGRIVLRAPISGNVVRRPAVLGQLASEEDSLATVADTTTMWAYCDIAEADAGRVEIGQAITLRTEGDPPHTWEGRITWVAAEVDRRTRTVTAHAVVPNPDGRLRANQFAQARIATNAARQAVVVPSDALQRVGELEVVFVRVSPGVYEPRVVVRAGIGDPVPVEGRVREGDEVVTTGAFLLRTEILPGSIGAGCCEVDPRGDD